MKRLALLVVLVLAVGLAAGSGTNLLFGKAKVKKVSSKETAASKKKSETASPLSQPTSITKAATSPQFSVSQAMGHTFALSEQIGVRPPGSVKEAAAADYIVQRLGEYGYTVEEQPFTMADGFASRNIVGTRRGTREGFTIVIGAHFDSPQDSKGADDDATGVGTVLELARDFATRRIEPTMEFVFFGGNRPGSTDMDTRLVGAHRYVELTGSLEMKDIVGMIEVDCIGQGDTLALRSQGTGLQRLKDKLLTFAGVKNTPVTYIKSADDSDNIPFENSQIPSVWVEWCNPGGTLSTDNAYTSVVAQKVQTAGVLIESFVLRLNSQDLEELKY